MVYKVKIIGILGLLLFDTKKQIIVTWMKKVKSLIWTKAVVNGQQHLKNHKLKPD